MTTEKFCTRCGKKFIATGREVICPACKQAAAEDAKRAAVMKAKTKSWTGESVPVRISGRASTVIRKYGAANGLPFAAALDDLLKASDYFKGVGVAWEDVEPYRSRRRDKAAADKQASDFLHGKQDAPQGVTSKPQGVTSKPQEVSQEAQAAGKPQEVKQAAKTSTTSKPQAAKKAVKTAAGKAAGKAGKK